MRLSLFRENDEIGDERPLRSENDIIQWLQSLFLFSLCWSTGGHIDSTSRNKFSEFVKNLLAGKNKAHPM